MNGKRWAALGIAAVILIISTGVSIVQSVVSSEREQALSKLIFPETEYTEEVIEEGNPMKKIVVLNVEGVIQDTGEAGSLVSTETYNHQSFMEKLDAIEEDSTVRGIVLRVNSRVVGLLKVQKSMIN